MIIFFSIPMWLVAFILLALVAIGIKIAQQVLFFIFLIVAIYYWLLMWLFWVLYDLKGKRISIPYAIFDSILCVAGFLINLFCINLIFKESGGIIALSILFIIGIVLQIVSLWITNIQTRVSNFASRTIIGLFCLVLCTWAIGYDLSYSIKCNDSNIAYYECVRLEKEEEGGQTFRSLEEAKAWVPARLNGDIYDTNGSDVTEIGEEHIIGTYDVGDKLVPGGSVIRYNPSPWETYPNQVWYTVLTDTGKTGYIPSTGIEVYHYREGEDITQKQKEKIEKSWYCWLPSTVLNFCENFFEKVPFGYKCSFAE